MKNTQIELLKVTTSEMKNTLGKINRLDIAEVVSELEDGNNLKWNRKRFFKNLNSAWVNCKSPSSSLCVISLQHREWKGQKKIPDEIIAESFPNVTKNHRSKKLNKPQPQETKKTAAQHITIKMLKMSDKEKNL